MSRKFFKKWILLHNSEREENSSFPSLFTINNYSFTEFLKMSFYRIYATRPKNHNFSVDCLILC